MKIIEILQREEFESQYNDSDPDTGMFSTSDYGNIHMNLHNAWDKLEETFSDEQIELYEKCYMPVAQIYEAMTRKIEFERGFKLAMKIMCESLG